MIDNVDSARKTIRHQAKYRPATPLHSTNAKSASAISRRCGRQMPRARPSSALPARRRVARNVVPGMSVRGALIQMGREQIELARGVRWYEVERNLFVCPDAVRKGRSSGKTRSSTTCRKPRLLRGARLEGRGQASWLRPPRADRRQARWRISPRAHELNAAKWLEIARALRPRAERG